MINIQDDTDYLFEKITDSIYIFAQPNTLELINSDTNSSITEGT